MATIGTRKFWKPLTGNGAQQAQPILKAQGYINITLHGAYYWSKGNLWQSVFGGTDRVSLVSQITYKAEADITVAAVQDIRKVPTNTGSFLGVSRALAVKVPANANAIELTIQVSAIASDNLAAVLGILSADEIKKPLELAPPVVGAALAITNVVKRALTAVGPQQRLEATYAGTIGAASTANPWAESRLVSGYLIVVATEKDEDAFLASIDSSKLAIVGDGLTYDGKSFPYTYVIYNISTEPRRGVDPATPWARKFRDSLQTLRKIVVEPANKLPILATARGQWVDGAALLEADPNYIDDEREEICAKALLDIKNKYENLSAAAPGPERRTINRGMDIEAFPGDSLRHFRDVSSLDKLETLSAKYTATLAGAGLAWPLDD